MAVQPVNAEFVAETGRQIASLSAFLGGFAATFLGILLQSPNSRRHVGWAAGAAAVASASFILAVISGTTLALVSHPGAPANMAKPTFLPEVRTLILFTFASGIYSILLSLGLSGWIRSRQLGIVASGRFDFRLHRVAFCPMVNKNFSLIVEPTTSRRTV